MSQTDESKIDVSELEKGKLYKFDGQNLVEIEANADVIKIHVTSEANEAVKDARAKVQKALKHRPELELVASAILIEGAKSPNLVETVREYGKRVWST